MGFQLEGGDVRNTAAVQRSWLKTALIAVALATLCAACTSQPTTSPHPTSTPGGISKIRHVVIIMQENRSFDSFFGTYPGADGIPARNGQP